ncbi:hypothetical protein Esti_000126 [Eimeria stiedai]
MKMFSYGCSVPLLRGLKSDGRRSAEAGLLQVVPAQRPLRGAPRGPPKVLSSVLAVVTVLLVVFVAYCFSRAFTKTSVHGPQPRRLAGGWTFVPEGCSHNGESDEESSADETEEAQEVDTRDDAGGWRETSDQGSDDELGYPSEGWQLLPDFSDLSRFELGDEEEGQSGQAKPLEPPDDPHDSKRESDKEAASDQDSAGDKAETKESSPGGKPHPREGKGQGTGAPVQGDGPIKGAASPSQQQQPSLSFWFPKNRSGSSLSAFLKKNWTKKRDLTDPSKSNNEGNDSDLSVHSPAEEGTSAEGKDDEEEGQSDLDLD